MTTPLALIYLLAVGLDGNLCRELIRRGHWRTGFFWYRLWAQKSVILLPMFFYQPQTYESLFWSAKAIEIVLSGWALAECSLIPRRFGLLLGLVGGIALMTFSPWSAYLVIAPLLCLFCACSVFRTKSVYAYGIMLIVTVEFVCLALRSWLDVGPVSAEVLALTLWLSTPLTVRSRA